MSNRRKVLTVVCAVALSALAAFAQEGHPLTGTWHGEWSPAAGQTTRIVLYMKWDTKEIVGTINPGPHAIPLTVATLDAEHWTVHFEGESKDKAVHISADGKLDNIGSYNRTIAGSWTQNGAMGNFKITRD